MKVRDLDMIYCEPNLLLCLNQMLILSSQTMKKPWLNRAKKAHLSTSMMQLKGYSSQFVQMLNKGKSPSPQSYNRN